MNTAAPSADTTDDRLFTWSMLTKGAAYAGVLVAVIAMSLGWFGEYWPTRMLGLSLTITGFVTPAMIMMIWVGRKKRIWWLPVLVATIIWGILGFLIIISLAAA
ncbi:MAG: hypothetical protein ACO1N2_02230 [Candidatus Saccharimonadota bacterium]